MLILPILFFFFSLLSQSPFFDGRTPSLYFLHAQSKSIWLNTTTTKCPNHATRPTCSSTMLAQTVWTKVSITKTQMWGLGLRRGTPIFIIQKSNRDFWVSSLRGFMFFISQELPKPKADTEGFFCARDFVRNTHRMFKP